MTSSIKNILLSFFALLFIVTNFSCQKEISGAGLTITPVILPDLSIMVSSSASGFVTDENDAPVQGASVLVGSKATTTDKYGYFEAKNVQVVKEAAVITVTQAGYFKGIKTYIGVANKAAFFRIKLLPKTIAGTINAATGGNVTLSNGLIVALPANAVVTASNNAVYTGTINVALKYIDPTAQNINQSMPGDLRGLTTDGSLKALTSYGMAAVELTGNSGELLQIASGKKATLTMPLSASLLSTAPATIPLWYFDETKGLWKQEGTATKTGNTYVGNVAHFSFWNCDIPNSYIHFDCTIVNSAGQPIPDILAVVSVVGQPYWASGFTDQAGYVGGAVPDNAQLKLDIYASYNCFGSPLYTQNFSTLNAAISLGNIAINVPSFTANVSGTITDCNSAPLSNGSIIVKINNQYSRYTASATGTYNFSMLICGGSSSAIFIGENTTANVQGTPLNYTIIVGNNIIPNLQACGTATQEFLNYTDNGGTTTILTMPADTIAHFGQGNTNYISSRQGSITYKSFDFSFENSGIAVGSTQNITNLSSTLFNPSSTISITAPSGVHITEYGAIGQFIAGNFTIAVSESTTPATAHTITCNFRVRRNF